ncbi:hypothetical protein NYP18_09580 [Corynebacterium sp. YIM 101645]|uniref:Uncharacterized protein n=1 Tax=Corynebacterium lemuris TaxID=1859292 RepID=A0ABT2FXE2_9CORY|nr:hypothetical protein [Corynebacterium lemuris]MCS5479905.1 hypothetical protein [Corynebacterium lemuris]
MDQTTALQVTVSGYSDQVDRQGAGQESCSYFDGWLSTGDEVALRDSNGKTLGVSQLRADEHVSNNPPGPGEVTVMCSWEASFEDVPIHYFAPTLRVGEFGEVSLSRDSVTQGNVRLRPRSAMGVLAGDDVLFEVR